jgi:hypothetical protein
MAAFHPTEPSGERRTSGRIGASGRVPAAEAERLLSVQSGDLRGDTDQWARRAESGRAPVLLGAGGIKPPLLFGEPIDQPVEDQPYLSAQPPGMWVERDDLHLWSAVIGEQRHQGPAGKQIEYDISRAQP